MLINFKDKIIFVRPTKVASSTVQLYLFNIMKNDEVLDLGNILISNDTLLISDLLVEENSKKSKHQLNFYEDSFKRGYHYTYDEIKKKLSIDISNFTIVTAIRNPYDHALSRYLYEPVLYENFKKLGLKQFLDIKKYIRGFIFSKIPLNEYFFHLYLKYAYQPYYLYFYSNGKDMSKIKIKLENLKEDLEEFAQNHNYINLGSKFKNLKIRKGVHYNYSQNVKKLYSERNRYLIEKMYGDFIKDNDYTFPG